MSESGIFEAAVKLLPDQRAAYLDAACGADAELRRDVESLLHAHDASGGILAQTTDHRPLDERPGAVVGPYRLMEQIGEGGFGLVFVAEQQQPVRRRVALKVLKPGMDTRDIIARFEAERQALALMDHPNIARVFDGGETASGRPYFVMELVKGVPITEYCDQHQLTPRERLSLFIDVCNAVQHAHTKGVIHRDIKPSNILVTSHDGKPVVKVIDFGVARAIGQRLTEKTIYTRFAQMIGTPLYMSPEQAEMSGLDIDTRSDIYSLGVLLYELLTGTTPFDGARLRRAAFDEIRRIIREEEPPRPSARLSSLGATLPAVSARRKTEPARLSALVRGELDWVVMKALEKDRTRRYETASSFAADVRRYLAEEPVEAGPPSATYRLRKFVRRNRGPVTAAAVVLAAVLLGAGVAAWGWVDAVRSRKAADEANTNARLAAEKEAATERRRADEAAARVRAVRAHLAFEKGSSRIDRGDVDAGLLLLARALEHAPDDEGELSDSIRRILGGWRPEKAVPTAVVTPPPDQQDTPEIYRTNAIEYSSDGRIFVIGGKLDDSRAFFQPFDAVTFRELAPPVAVGSLVEELNKLQEITMLELSGDGRRLVTAGDNRVQIWDLPACKPRGKPLKQPDGNGGLWNITLSPDGKQLLVCYRDAGPSLWDVQTGRLLHVLELPDRKEKCIAQAAAFWKEGTRVLTATKDCIRVWDTKTGKDVGYVIATGAQATAITVSPDETEVIAALKQDAAALDELVCLDIQGAKPPRSFSPRRDDAQQGGISRIRFAPNSPLLVTLGGEASLAFWEYDAKESPRPIGRVRKQTALDVAFQPEGKYFVTACEIRPWSKIGVARWDNPIVRRRQIGSGLFTGTSFRRDGKVMATSLAGAVNDSNDPGDIRLWDVETGKQLGGPLRAPGFVPYGFRAVFSPDGKSLAVGGVIGRGVETSAGTPAVQLWDVEKREPLGKPLVHDACMVTSLAFDASGRNLLSVNARARDARDAVFRRWDLATGKAIERREYRDTNSMYLRISPAGGYYLAWLQGSLRDRLKLFDATTGELVRGETVLPNHHEDFVFTDDDRKLVTIRASRGTGEVRLWDVATGKLLAEAPPVNMEPSTYAYWGKGAISSDGRWLASAVDQRIHFWELATLRPLGPPITVVGKVYGVAFRPNSDELAVATESRGVQLIPVPPAVEGTAERLRLWVEVATGKRLDGDSVVDLDLQAWRQHCYDRLQQLGGPP